MLARLAGLPTLLYRQVPRERFRARQRQSTEAPLPTSGVLADRTRAKSHSYWYEAEKRVGEARAASQPLLCCASRLPPCPEGKFSWVCNRCARRRSTDNATAVDVLHANEQLWRSVHGPAPEDLFKPTPEALAEARRAADDLESMAASQQHFRDGFDVFAQETVEAARALRSLDWSAIHAEKFHITPQPVLRDR